MQKIYALMGILLLIVLGCTTQTTVEKSSQEEAIGSTHQQPPPVPETEEIVDLLEGEEETEAETEDTVETVELVDSDEEEEILSWTMVELRDVSTGETFTIDQFKGTTVLLESFAVWCPVCTQQQKNIGSLHDLVGDKVISISLDTDPNEDEDRVLQHIQARGFDWRYSVSPKPMTTGLIDEFGVGVVNAPQAPVILICPDQNDRRLLGRGIKTVEELEKALSLCQV